MAWVLRRTDQGGGYVAPSGSAKSYTRSKASAERFATAADASRAACVNETPVEL